MDKWIWLVDIFNEGRLDAQYHISYDEYRSQYAQVLSPSQTPIDKMDVVVRQIHRYIRENPFQESTYQVAFS